MVYWNLTWWNLDSLEGEKFPLGQFETGAQRLSSALVVLLQLHKIQGLSVCPPLPRAKKIRNKAVVNTSTLVKESRAENSKLLLGCGNSRIAGKLAQESVQVPASSQEAGDRRRGRGGGWGIPGTLSRMILA